ncbi:Aldehyde dehydrogenase [Blattella germanica]|nr:Aldehyde dehydrogenase [Blattella germanica]
MTSYSGIVQRARDVFESGRTRSIEFRRKQLQQMMKMYEENTTEMVEALAKDIRKSKQEAVLFEIQLLTNEVLHALQCLKEWTAPEKPPKSFVNTFDEVVIHKDPYGVVLIIGAWNYPLQLTLLPLVGAVAAGNCAIIKPSELAPVTAQLIANLIPKYLDQEAFHVIQGGVPETTELLKERFDYIFYTGSTNVGKIVRAAANEYLTPVTLELGGKSPVYIDNTVDVEVAAKRILWGKCANSGQTCIAPDYILCSKQVEREFVEKSKKVLKEFYGDNIKSSPDLCRIISDRHYQPHPLTMYVFSKDKSIQDLLVSQLRSGSVCVNDTLMQFCGE